MVFIFEDFGDFLSLHKSENNVNQKKKRPRF